MKVTVVAAVARSAPIGRSVTKMFRAAALYKAPAITTASVVAGPPLGPTPVVANWLAALPCAFSITYKGTLAVQVTAAPPSDSRSCE
jgi:hypothetical protein